MNKKIIYTSISIFWLVVAVGTAIFSFYLFNTSTGNFEKFVMANIYLLFALQFGFVGKLFADEIKHQI